jgi:hypothetical protein
MYALLSLILTCWLSTTDPPQSEILPNGTYRFEIAFAEWGGKTMCDEVILILNDAHITLKISENSNSLWMGAKPGDVIEEGTLRKHQSGQWIISNDEKDIYLEEIGGCTGGPTIIHFENQTIEMC